MRVQHAAAGPSVTKMGDDRLTPVGARLRRWKVDELPQLWNVLKGDMSLVGARPKVPKHQIFRLEYRPGITGPASLAFRDEERILHRVSAAALDDYQIHVMMPLKMEIDQNYMRHATFLSDLKIIMATALGRGERIDAEHLTELQTNMLAFRVMLPGPFTSASEQSREMVA